MDEKTPTWYADNAKEGPKRRSSWGSQYGVVALDHINPHCDDKVLHSPDLKCEVCDLFPEAQMLRDQWKMNFTGESDPLKTRCPSEGVRPINTIYAWPGNRPHRSGEPVAYTDAIGGSDVSLTREEIAEARSALVQMERELNEAEEQLEE